MKKIIGIYFICCIGNYLNIIKEQIEILVSSGLYDKSDKIICYISLYNEHDNELKEILFHFNKIFLITSNTNLFEKFAINNYKKDIKNLFGDEKYYLYYFHTKGVTKEIDSIFSNRRKILNYYILQKHEICLNLIEFFDCVGCSLDRYPKIHFSGNFWWSKSDYLNTLDDNISDKYLAPEMYICSNPNCKPISLCQHTNNGDVLFHINRNDYEICSNLSSNCNENLEMNIEYVHSLC